LPPTQSSLKKQNGEYQPNTLHKWFFWFSPHVTCPDGIAQCEYLNHEYLTLGHL
jgi:hypothetical protein